ARGLRLELTQVYDETVYIKQSIRMVQSNILFGGSFAIIVLMLFLRNWRATLAVALAIPIAVIGTFVVVAALGRTLNVISLAGMAFAVGMVLDSAIVVLENIYRHHQMGKRVFDAALDGAREVWAAVLAGTLTTMAVFIPVIFVREEAGQLFRDISIATATAVGLSLIVSVTVIPTLAARLLGLRRPGARATWRGKEHTGWVAAAVAGLVNRVNSSSVARLAVILVMTGSALGLARTLIPDTTYLPAGNRNLVFGYLLTPPGYSLDEFHRMALTIDEVIRPYWEAEPDSPEKERLDQQWVRQVGGMIEAGEIPELVDNAENKLSWLQRARARREWLDPPPLIDNFFFVSWGGGCFMGASSRDPARVKPLVRLLQTAGTRIPGVFSFFSQASLFRFGGGNTAEIQIRSDDLEKVTTAATAMYGACDQAFGQPRPSPNNFNLGRPELQIVPDHERAADLGLNVVDVGLIVEACVDGAYVGDYRVAGGDTIDISLYVRGQKGLPTQEIGQVPIHTPTGSVVPLSAAVRLVDTTALEQINHVERQRAVTLLVNPPEAMALEAVIRQIKEEMEPELRGTGQIDPSVLVSLTGNADKLDAARNTMIGDWQGFTLQSLVNLFGSRFFLSIIIVYLLMAALYESWVYPLVIMFSVPLAVFGGFLGLSVANWATLLTTSQPVQQLDVLTFLGFVILVGIVVNNAILLVNQSLLNMREHGMESHAAIRDAVRVRVRPVLMTSLTTFFGQLPLALFPGAGSELYRGLASVMLGGLIIATIGTLVLVPAALSLVTDIRTRLARVVRGTAAVAPAPRDR
ncbi:MAG: efflux RND transporter permease subunit, partial [Phycisphaerae bacterium]